MNIYAFRVSDDAGDVLKIHQSLLAGEGRFGWSGDRTADLRQLQASIEQHGWESLTSNQRECYQGFLLLLREGDYVVYINVPKWGECTLARVAGPYEWRYEDNDFNHRFPVDPESVAKFDRNDAALVHPALSRRLKLQGRWWRVYAESEFSMLLQLLRSPTDFEAKKPETNLRYLSRDFRPQLQEIRRCIQHAHPSHDLEDFIALLLRRVPGVADVRRLQGRADRGADLLVDLEFGNMPELRQVLVVQVKSFEGEHGGAEAVDQIAAALEYHSAHMGLIASTADAPGETLERALENAASDDSIRPIGLLIGDDFAEFVLRFGADLLLRDNHD